MRKRPHERLIAWQESYKLCVHVYGETKKFPAAEKYALVSQIRRSAYSVPMNIAEGNTKRSNKEKILYFERSLASLEELHCQLRLSFDLKYLSNEKFLYFDNWMNRVSYLITKLRASFVKDLKES